MKNIASPSMMDIIIVPRKRKYIHATSAQIPQTTSERWPYMMHQLESLKNALDSIRQICENENIRPKMKLTLVENIANLAIGLNDD